LSYEIYLSHMFCVFGGLALFNAYSPEGPWRFLWYPPILLVCWLLGYALSRGFTLPVERRLRTWFRRPLTADPSRSAAGGDSEPC
jgi:hypothetical protein